MKKSIILEFIFILLFFALITKISSSELIWEFEKVAINLLSNSDSYTYTITQGKVNNTEFRLEKKIIKEGNKINHNNTLYINQKFIEDVDWEDIDSFYNVKGNNYICPTGKKHMHIYNNSRLVRVSPESFKPLSNWELKCYYLEEKYVLLTFFLNNENNEEIQIYKYDLNTELLKEDLISIRDNDIRALFGFRWTTDDSGKNKDSFIAITSNSGTIDLKNYIFQGNEFGNEGRVTIGNSFGNTKVNHDNYRNYFYLVSYNSNSFTSGYIKETNNITKDNIESNKNNITTDDIFKDYVENIYINSVNLIKNSKYAYYEVSNGGKTFHGMIDIESKKIIFNTKEEIISFKPYTNNSMLAITSKSAYKICAIKGSDNDCIDECLKGSVKYDFSKTNQC